jgi:hypothetical protein
MMRWLLLLVVFVRTPLLAGTAADLARAIRENSFDRDECYRVRDLTLVKDAVRFYFTDGHLIFSRPIAGRRVAAVFTADVEQGDGEVIMLPPDRSERMSLAHYTGSPNLDEHFRAALLLFTGDDYDTLKSQLPGNPANKKAPEIGALLDEEWTPVLRNLGASYLTRITLDLIDGPGQSRGLFAALISSPKFTNFDIVYDPEAREQVFAGKMVTRENRLFFDTWASFVAKSRRQNPSPLPERLEVSNYRIEATVESDLTLNVVTRAKVKSLVDGLRATTFDITPDMDISEVTVDGQPAEVLQRDSLRLNLSRGGNNLFLVVPPEPLRTGREYEFAFHHSGKVIHEAGDRVFFVSSRGSWYPTHSLQFADYDLQFRYPRDLDLVTPGDVVEDRTDGEWRITRRRTPFPIRIAAFNLGNYEHARVQRGGFVVDVCANRALENALLPRPQTQIVPPQVTGRRPRADALTTTTVTPPAPNPMERLHTLAEEVASAMEFMTSKFGPPALPHLTVSPIPGTFGQGFPGLVYLSTFAYLKDLAHTGTNLTEPQEIFFADALQAHETAHQWWGNRVTATTYRDYWLMEALANYSALLYLEKSKGERPTDLLLDDYRRNLLLKNEAGETVDSRGPIVLGPRLESSREPRAWRAITYGKGTWILQMLRRRMGDERFLSLLAEVLKRYDHKDISTEQFRELAAGFLPPKTDDPKLEAFFDQWVYGTGIPALKLTYTIRGKAPSLRLVGTLTQTDVAEDFSAVAPVEIQLGRGRTITHWVRSASAPVTFTVPVQQAPVKVTLDPRRAVLRR